MSPPPRTSVVGPYEYRNGGQALVRRHSHGGISVLCPHGIQVTAWHPGDSPWGGGYFEARVAFGWGWVGCDCPPDKPRAVLAEHIRQPPAGGQDPTGER